MYFLYISLWIYTDAFSLTLCRTILHILGNFLFSKQCFRDHHMSAHLYMSTSLISMPAHYFPCMYVTLFTKCPLDVLWYVFLFFTIASNIAVNFHVYFCTMCYFYVIKSF